MRELDEYVHARLQDELRKIRRDFSAIMPELNDIYTFIQLEEI